MVCRATRSEWAGPWRLRRHAAGICPTTPDPLVHTGRARIQRGHHGLRSAGWTNWHLYDQRQHNAMRSPSGEPIPCTALANSSSFGISLTLLGATKNTYQLSVGVTHGYHGAGTYLISPAGDQVTPQPAPAATITVADSISHQFWTATSGTLTITGAGKSGMVSAVLQASDGSTASASPQAALLDGPWACG
jgi:hypothetical protein